MPQSIQCRGQNPGKLLWLKGYLTASSEHTEHENEECGLKC